MSLSSKPSDASSHATSPTLVRRVQANEEAAWQRLVDLYGPLIFSWACRGGLANEDAADVMQEVFASVAKAIRRFDPAARGRFRGWLWTITRNKLRDHHRRFAEEPEGRGPGLLTCVGGASGSGYTWKISPIGLTQPLPRL